MKKKGMSIEDCISRAEKIISKHGICLLLFDVVGSRNYNDRNALQIELKKFMHSINKKFSIYLPKNNLATLSKDEKGFQYLLGDSSWAGINSAKIIKDIINYQKENFPNFSLYWAVAKDRYDNIGISLVK